LEQSSKRSEIITATYRKGRAEETIPQGKSLQFILTRSFAAKLLAVKKVTENKGKRTPGVDHQLWSTAKAKWNAAKNLNMKDYKASPLKSVSIPKANGKTRQLGIPTMQDRAFQALFLMALEPLAEATAD